MKRKIPLAVWLILIAASAALANPVPDPVPGMLTGAYYIRTFPINYSVDLLALFIAIGVSGETSGFRWIMTPIYALLVCAAGYFADFLGVSISGYPVYWNLSESESLGPIVSQYHDFNEITFANGFQFMMITSLAIFAFNLIALFIIFKINEAESFKRIPLGAGIIALITSPYVALKEEAVPAWFAPVLLVLIMLTIFYFADGVRYIKHRGRS